MNPKSDNLMADSIGSYSARSTSRHRQHQPPISLTSQGIPEENAMNF